MATKKETTTKASPVTEKDLQDKLAELRKDYPEQLRSVKTGMATNVRIAAKTKKEIARVLTKLNQLKKEGERK